MTESSVDAPTPQSNPPKSTSLLVGTACFILVWLGVTVLCGISTFILFANQSLVLLLAFGCILVLGPLAALLFGLVLGPKWWPRFYVWIDNHPVLIAMLPGGGSALVFAQIGIWIPAIFLDRASTQGGATLVAMFILSPAALLIAPIVGGFGGILAALIGNRFSVKPHHWIWGALGGTVAGLVFGVVPFVLLGSM